MYPVLYLIIFMTRHISSASLISDLNALLSRRIEVRELILHSCVSRACYVFLSVWKLS